MKYVFKLRIFKDSNTWYCFPNLEMWMIFQESFERSLYCSVKTNRLPRELFSLVGSKRAIRKADFHRWRDFSMVSLVVHAYVKILKRLLCAYTKRGFIILSPCSVFYITDFMSYSTHGIILFIITIFHCFI